MKTVGLVYNPEVPTAITLANELVKVVEEAGYTAWLGSAWDESVVTEAMPSLDAVVTLGGDGTILRAARLAGPAGVPIIGVNLGRVGFLAELNPGVAPELLPRLLAGDGWVERRAMLKADLVKADGFAVISAPYPVDATRRGFVALNDVLIGRGERCRTVELRVSVNGGYLTTYRSDGVVIATPTGSTAYSLSAGGPILYPEMKNLVLTPLLTHLRLTPPLVLPGDSRIRVEINTDHSATFSIDGHIDVRLSNGAEVAVELAPCEAKFLRLQDRSYFYHTIAERLRW